MSRAEEKTERVRAALEHREADRVPVGEFFWTEFLRRCRRELDAGDGFDPYRHWDLDLIVVNPNLDPWIRGIEVLEDTAERKLVRTGYGATIERRSDCPMPRFLSFEVGSVEALERVELDAPDDPRRFLEAIDDQINSVGDDLVLGLAPWLERVKACAEDFCVFGGVTEVQEQIWRIIGPERVYLEMALDPERLARVARRLGDWLARLVDAQVEAAGGRLSGMYVWGDVACTRGMLFSPDLWRRVHKEPLARICERTHRAGLPVIYHGCGRALDIFEDLIEVGIDAYNPLEAKAGLDVLELRERYGDRLAFVGNIDVRVLERGDEAEIRAEVLRKLEAARGGGYILQSDHSIPGTVSPRAYDLAVRTAREHGEYPLALPALPRPAGPGSDTPEEGRA